MASTYSALKIELIGTGEQAGTWGTTTNTNLGTALEEAITGRATANFTTDADLTLGYSDSNATQTFRNLILNVTSVSLSTTRNLIVPTIEKQYLVENNTTGGQSIVIKTAAGTGITIPNGKKAHVYADGTNVVQASDFFPTIDINGGTIDGATIGASSAGVATFTNLTASGTVNFSGATVSNGGTVTTVDINGGTIDGTTIGGSTPAAGTFTTLSSTGNTTLGNATTDTVTVNGYMGVGGAPASYIGMNLVSDALTSSIQIGSLSNPTFTSSATTSAVSFFGKLSTQAASFTVSNAYAFYAEDATKGAGSTITNQYGLHVRDQTQGTNNYGITSQVSSGTNKWNIYASGTAANYFAGNVQFAAGSAAAPALTRFGDDNTGIFFPAADTIAFAEGGAEAMRIDSVGNVLVGGTAARGTTVGAAHLDLFNGTAPAGTLTNGISLYSSSGDFLFMDAAGNGYKVGYRNVPAVGTKTGSYTLATGDVGKYVQVGSGGSITIPDATFAEGDAVSIFNNTSGDITITCTITTAYIAGTDSDKASVTLATRGVATILFISSTVCVISGNVS